MSTTLSPDGQAILLLTAPLMAGRMELSADLLTLGEYGCLAVFLHEVQRGPGDLLTVDADSLIRQCQEIVDGDRLRQLLGRGFLLSQAVDRWQARAIWVVTSADTSYPQRLKERLKDNAPAVLYGCGDATILETGGLAVVGSRNATPALQTYTEHIGQLAAHAQQTVVSGGARGIDQASMRGALEAGGTAVGMFADSLEQAALYREYRSPLMEGRLVLVSPYDPMAGFNVGNAMQRNKLIYALADAALVISSDYQKGGTWAGAVEQLTKLRLVPVFVRSCGDIGKGIQELQNMGALPWPNPSNPAELVRTLRLEQDPTTTTHNEEVVPTHAHQSMAEPPIAMQTKPAPTKRRARPAKPAGIIAEPTLFDSTPEAITPKKRAATAHKKTEGKTDGEEGEADHADD
ncbi:DNA-processing protein DprA [Candidatus Cryosericum septentrionale]|jgi:DNA processing protein|uniref:DNA-processing protein DprA n=1 Tax=Candidatus Cryosericum septentrionale TaxID=2290913 RepID=A0A398DLE4_9BACT|nr:DNA-processing protein DprA [Candidatus Cryosericum septentrionale]RIE16402.1 DNA-processing protein DprA [Candidatus Cryosericum septentrionale]